MRLNLSLASRLFLPLVLVLVPVLSLALPGCSKTHEAPPLSTASLGDRPPAAEAPQQPAYRWNGDPSRIETGSVSPSAPAPAAPPLTWQASPRAPERTAAAVAEPLKSGEIEVKPGETLYTLSRRHGVPVTAFVDTNKLASVDLKAGQRLRLPAGAR